MSTPAYLLYMTWLMMLPLTPIATALALLLHLRSPAQGRSADLVAFAMANWCAFFPLGNALAPMILKIEAGPDEMLGAGVLLLAPGGLVGTPCALAAAFAYAISMHRERQAAGVIGTRTSKEAV